MRRVTFIFAAVLIANCIAVLRTSHANIIGPTDDRGSLIELGPQLGLSPEEIRQARTATGYVRCPGTTFKNGTTASGALVLSNQTVVTTAHTFIDRQGRWRDPISECYFLSQSERPLKIKFDPDKIVVGTRRPFDEAKNDWSVAHLVAPIKDAKPYRFLPPDAPLLSADPRLISISAWASGFKSNRSIPIVQQCKIMYESSRAGPIYSDCDSSQGMSGSIILTRRAGELLAVGIIIGSGLDTQDWQPFKLIDGPNASATQHIVFQGEFARALGWFDDPK